MAGRRWVPLIVLNACFAAYALVRLGWPQPLVLSALINLLILCVPGVAWLRLFGRGVVDRASAAVLVVALSAGAGVIALVAQMLLGVHATAHTHAAGLALLTNLGLLVTWGRPWPSAARSPVALPWFSLLPVGIVVYVALFLCATRFVEPIEDQDIEVQGTAYGLVTRGAPLMLHDRRLPYHFPHPHLLHWLAAEVLLLADDIEAVKPYCDAALEAERRLKTPFGPDDVGDTLDLGERFMDAATGGWRWEPHVVRVEAVENDAIVLDHEIPILRPGEAKPRVTRFPTHVELRNEVLDAMYYRCLTRTFDGRPLLWQTRAPNLGLALVALFLLHELAALLSGSRLVALLVPFAYAAVPEVIGRHCCAAYMTITIVFLLAAGWRYLAPRGEGKPTWPWGLSFAAAALMAVANHKGVVALGAMVVGGALFSCLRGRWRAGVRSAFTSPVAWGFLAGTAVFWVHGLIVAGDFFIQDHVRYHLVNRVAHVDALGYVGAGVYPTVGELWSGFVLDAGAALPVLGIVALGWLLARGYGGSRHVLVLILWGVVVSVAFSAVDWRQTKHLMHLIPVLALMPAAAAGRSSKSGRAVWAGLLLVAVAAAAFLSVRWFVNGFDWFTPVRTW